MKKMKNTDQEESIWRLHTGDCIQLMGLMPPRFVDLVFADPPYNIGYVYDIYDDRKKFHEYMTWTRDWGIQVKKILKPHGSFWLAIGDAYASDLDVLMRRELGFHRRSWVVWHYTFGMNSVKRFTPSHTHFFHYVVDPGNFTFNGDAIKVPSARQMVYGDKRAKAGGRLPDDVWILRPQDAPEGTEQPPFDTWYNSRVCGTYKERVDFPCQMPEAILERIIKVSSNEGDMVLDPFLGSGTTGVAAVRLKRKFIGLELSADYRELAEERIAKQIV